MKLSSAFILVFFSTNFIMAQQSWISMMREGKSFREIKMIFDSKYHSDSDKNFRKVKEDESAQYHR